MAAVLVSKVEFDWVEGGANEGMDCERSVLTDGSAKNEVRDVDG